MLTFSLGGEVYGVDILRVKEIRGWSPVTRIPQTPDSMLGVLNLRGAHRAHHRSARALRAQGRGIHAAHRDHRVVAAHAGRASANAASSSTTSTTWSTSPSTASSRRLNSVAGRSQRIHRRDHVARRADVDTAQRGKPGSHDIRSSIALADAGRLTTVTFSPRKHRDFACASTCSRTFVSPCSCSHWCWSRWPSPPG